MESPSGPALVNTTDIAADPFTEWPAQQPRVRPRVLAIGHAALNNVASEAAPPLFVVIDGAVQPILLQLHRRRWHGRQVARRSSCRSGRNADTLRRHNRSTAGRNPNCVIRGRRGNKRRRLAPAPAAR